MMHPKYIRFVKQIIPFGIIWLIYALVYSLVEFGLLGDLKQYPTTGNSYNFRNNISLILWVSFFMGLVQGFIEIKWLRKRFTLKALWVKIVLKSIFYFLLIIVFLVLTTILNSIMNPDISTVLNDLKQFITAFSFWSIVIYSSVTLGLAVFFSEISEYLGAEVFYNFFFGKYHTPKQEIRIFMFLDMKSSTTIAEEIGHEKYFNLIKDYYADMTNAILETFGEIYQYVGDEIVVSWSEKKGIYNNNCIVCFDKISKTFAEKKEYYLKNHGLVPSFKAGYHIGEVTIGEIGIIKRDIIYTGDVLNTTARIQSECNNYNAKALISEDLIKELSKNNTHSFIKIDKLSLRGKQERIQLYKIDFTYS